MGGLCQTCGWFFGMFKYSSEIQKFEPLRQFNFPFFGIDINLHENIERCILETFNIRNERRIERMFHLFHFFSTFKKFVVDFIHNSNVSWIE